jgi:hypothetical protein
MGEIKRENMFLAGNKSTGVVRIFVNCQETTFTKGTVKSVIGI